MSATCEMGGRPEPTPWFMRLWMGPAHPGPVVYPVPEYQDTWGADAATPSDLEPDPDPALEALTAMVAPVVQGWIPVADVRQIIDELCYQIAWALHRGEVVKLVGLGTLTRGPDGRVTYQPDPALSAPHARGR